MSWYAITLNGEEVRRVFALSPENLELQLREGETAAESDPPHMAPPPAAPPAETIDDLRDYRWTQAKDYRDSRTNGTCATPSGVVQCDDASKLKINGAVNMAMLAEQAGQAYSINWTMADNSVATLGAKAMIAMGIAVGQYVAACQDASTAVRAKIDAAGTADDLAAIDLTAGYPADASASVPAAAPAPQAAS